MSDNTASEWRHIIDRMGGEMSSYLGPRHTKLNPYNVYEIIEDLQAEIERLQKELKQCLHLDNHNNIVRSLQQERDALRGKLDKVREYCNKNLTYGFQLKQILEILNE